MVSRLATCQVHMQPLACQHCLALYIVHLQPGCLHFGTSDTSELVLSVYMCLAVDRYLLLRSSSWNIGIQLGASELFLFGFVFASLIMCTTLLC